jgi:hypothetical protein
MAEEQKMRKTEPAAPSARLKESLALLEESTHGVPSAIVERAGRILGRVYERFADMPRVDVSTVRLYSFDSVSLWWDDPPVESRESFFLVTVEESKRGIFVTTNLPEVLH